MGVCGGGGGDGGAGEARQREEERQRKIREGSAKVAEIFGGPFNYEEVIDEPNPNAGKVLGKYTFPGGQPSFPGFQQNNNVFAPDTIKKTVQRSGEHEGQFTDDYYNSIGDAFVDYYLPQVQDEYQQAQRKLAFNPGGTRSSSYGRRAGRLGQAFERTKGDVSDKALAAQAQRRSQVEDQRRQIMASVRGGAGAEEAAASASAAAKAMKAPPVYEPIGDIFSRYLNTAANATVADNEGYGRSALSLNNFFKPSGKSAVTTVG